MNVDADTLLEGLNPEQADAVRSSEGPLLVLAGAGSGKTRVLTQRIAWLVGVNGIAPESIFAVTFTNKAAGEMRARVGKQLGVIARGVVLSTFHSACLRILRREIGALGFPENFAIYDEADAAGVVRKALQHHKEPDKRADARRMRWKIDQWKNQGLLPEEVPCAPHSKYDRRNIEIYATYQRLLREAHALDFGDLLMTTALLFQAKPEVLQRYRERWNYIMVDEYQDTNRVQYLLVNLLAAKHRNLCVVGDPDQSIYAWRGADIRNILDFERDYPDAKVVKLVRNYRSTQEILSAADAVISHNPDRPKKEMTAQRGEGKTLRLYEARNERDEAEYVVKDILDEQGAASRSLGKFAVLYRTNAQSRPFEDELLKYNLPYVVVGGVRFYERAEVKDVLAYLRLLLNPADNQALERIVNRPTRGIGKTTLGKAQQQAQAENTPLLEGLRRLAEGGARSAAKVRAFLELLDALRADVPSLQPAAAVECVLERSGTMASLAAQATPEAEARVENLHEFIVAAGEFEQMDEPDPDDRRTALERFLDQVALVSDLDNAQLGDERVSLMTVHSAKGLEFECVYLAGMEEGMFPHASAVGGEPGELEEERRLCYVGMTRAMDRLTLSYAPERRTYGSLSFHVASRFLREIPERLLEFQGGAGMPRPRVQPGDSGRRYDYTYDQSGDYEGGEHAGVTPGMRVRHHNFGVGTILEIEGRGPNCKLRVRFDRAGVKKLMLHFANLEPE